MVEGKLETRMSNPTALVQKLWNYCNNRTTGKPSERLQLMPGR